MKENEVKISEELVEEVRLLLCEDCSEGPERYEYQASLDDPICAVGAEKECRERARKAITRILSAVRDGHKIPGEVGRFDFHMRRWDDFESWAGEMLSIVGTSVFIALDPEEASDD